MPGLPRGADHIDRSAGIPEEGSSRTKVIPLEAATPKCKRRQMGAVEARFVATCPALALVRQWEALNE